jgi:hypothetical protein
MKNFDDVLDTDEELSARSEIVLVLARVRNLLGFLLGGLFLFLRECATWGSLPRLFLQRRRNILATDISNDLDWRRLHISTAVVCHA